MEEVFIASAASLLIGFVCVDLVFDSLHVSNSREICQQPTRPTTAKGTHSPPAADSAVLYNTSPHANQHRTELQHYYLNLLKAKHINAGVAVAITGGAYFSWVSSNPVTHQILYYLIIPATLIYLLFICPHYVQIVRLRERRQPCAPGPSTPALITLPGPDTPVTDKNKPNGRGGENGKDADMYDPSIIRHETPDSALRLQFLDEKEKELLDGWRSRILPPRCIILVVLMYTVVLCAREAEATKRRKGDI